MRSLGNDRDPEQPVRDQALTTVDARISELDAAKRLPLVHQTEAITNAENRCRMTAMGAAAVWVAPSTIVGFGVEPGRSPTKSRMVAFRS
jgi:hypothetical protein